MAIVAASCGSYEQASYYDNDGIYSDNAPRMVEKRPAQTQNQEENTYSAYFGEKASQYDEILDSEIFTDIDSYSSNTDTLNIEDGQLTDYYSTENDYQGYGGWGDNATSVSINFYDNGWNNWGVAGFGWASPLWGWNYGYGPYYGYGWFSPWGWNRWNNWNYGGFGYRGFGFGYAGFGFGWNYPYYNYGYGYGNRYYNRNNRFVNRSYAYNNTRRGNYTRSNNTTSATALRGRSNVNTRGDSPRYRTTTSRTATARSSANTRSSRTYSGTTTTRRTVGVDQNRAYRTSRSTRAVPRYNSSRNANISSRYYNGTTRSSSRIATPRTSSYRSSGNNYSTGRSTNSTFRSSGNSSSRSSGTMRSSSGSSSRSSGSMRSSSGSSSRSSGSSSSSRSGGRRN
ncbi:hypothetical protein [Maribacter sp. MAR_2009_72]|uniref:hypothetical protein n=1 Tax=Maribacter sp. MAR_2009_72 TaxID=1250050 RepID=UPI0011A178CA|nr:hypothetical protein [Maribacter sp. MAR_2009_72]